MTNSNETETGRVSRRTALKGIGGGAAALSGVTITAVAADSGNGNGADPDTSVNTFRQFQKDPANIGEIETAGPRKNITDKWVFSPEGVSGGGGGDGGIWGGPALANGTVYIGDTNGHLYAVEAETGNKRWQVNTVEEGTGITGTPAVVDGTVYFGVEQGDTVHAVDAETGERIWQTRARTNGPLTVVNGTVFTSGGQGSGSGTVEALDAETGESLWFWSKGHEKSFVHCAVAVDYGTVYVTQRDDSPTGEHDNVWALNAETGEVQWSYEATNTVHGSPTVANGTVYFGRSKRDDAAAKLFALNAETGDERWQFTVPNSIHFSPAVANGIVFAPSHAGLYAVNAGTGEELWNYRTKGRLHRVETAPVVAEDIVYFGRHKGNLWSFDMWIHAMDARTGKEHWNYKVGGTTTPNSLAVVNDSVYFGTEHPRVYRLDGDTRGNSG